MTTDRFIEYKAGFDWTFEESLLQFPIINCKNCSNDKFEVGQLNYITVGKCTECGNIQLIHEG